MVKEISTIKDRFQFEIQRYSKILCVFLNGILVLNS